MEQIPTEVMEKIEKEFPILESASNADKDYMAVMSPNDTNWNRREGAEFGYRLLCEGKEKEIAELKDGLEEMKSKINDIIDYTDGIPREMAYKLHNKASELLKQHIDNL